MPVISHFLLGFIVSFIGSIPPASINLLVIKKASTAGIRQALRFTAGAVIIEFLYSYIAIVFSELLVKSETIHQYLQLFSIPVFLLLGYFSMRKKSEQHAEVKEIKKGNEFLNGIFMGIINPLQIPFWVFYSSYFISIGWLKEETWLIWTFVTGICLGTFALMVLLAWYSKKWFYGNTSSRFNGELMNKIIGWIFIMLGVYQLFHLLWTSFGRFYMVSITA